MSIIPTDKLKTDIEQIEAKWLATWLGSQAAPPSGRLYHYTDSAGLIGILKSSLFWATNIYYLNDRSEVKHCADLIKERLAHALVRLSGPIAILLARARDEFNPFEVLTVYVACFSEDGDQLSQWRAYGYAGSGYSIGISPRYDHPSKEVPRIVLRKVIYRRDQQIALIDDAIIALRDLAEPLLRNGHLPDFEPMADLLVKFFKRRVGDYLWCFKDPAFEEEREWRFSYIAGPLGMAFGDPGREIKFRPSRSGVVPYVELDLLKLRRGDQERLVISDIVCGPTLHPTESMAAVNTLLHATKHIGVQVTQSRVPLRR